MIQNAGKIRRLTLHSLLSFGDVPTSLDLRPLNVLIGPNASGKSNFLEALDLVRSTSSDLPGTLRIGGGVGEWIWKSASGRKVATVGVVAEHSSSELPLHYRLSFVETAQHFVVTEERIQK